MNRKLFEEPPFDLIHSIEGEHSAVSFFRDESDSFQIVVSPNESRFAKSSLAFLEPILPVGSNWSSSLDTVNIFGTPFKPEANSLFYALGAERITPHKSRGAFPEMYAKIFDITSNKEKVVAAIDKILGIKYAGERHYSDSSYGFVTPKRTDVETASYILRCALTSLKQDFLFLFHTSIIYENEFTLIPKRSYFFAKYSDDFHFARRDYPKIVSQRSMFSVNERVLDSFSMTNRTIIRGLKLILP